MRRIAAFEEEDGEPVLVVQGDADNRFSRHQNRQSTDPSTSSGYVCERVALRKLVHNSWFEVSGGLGAGLRIKLGERAKKVREGKEPKPQAA